MILHCSSVPACDLNTVEGNSLTVRWNRNSPLAISCCYQYTTVSSTCRSDFDQSLSCLEVGDSDLIEFVRASVEILENELDSHHSNLAVRKSIHNYYLSLGDFHEGQNSLDWVDRSEKIATDLRNDHRSSSAAALRSHVADSHAVRFAAYLPAFFQ